MPVLLLQTGPVVCRTPSVVAVSRDHHVLRTFRKAVLREARKSVAELAAMGETTQAALAEAELERLTKALNLLIPETNSQLRGA
ncbi:unnamed protein product [marine sediment metagenome]|uniref:Uncharacterized protein n=1 Tax=marine sediment metagenome TaxID=412755 RepID=X0VYU0_9ZZZZ